MFPFSIQPTNDDERWMLEALKEAHIKAIENYETRSYKCPTAIFYASKQPLGIYPDPTLGWRELIEGELELHEIPGHHLSIFVEPSVCFLAKKLRICIDKAQNRSELGN